MWIKVWPSFAYFPDQSKRDIFCVSVFRLLMGTCYVAWIYHGQGFLIISITLLTGLFPLQEVWCWWMYTRKYGYSCSNSTVLVSHLICFPNLLSLYYTPPSPHYYIIFAGFLRYCKSYFRFIEIPCESVPREHK